MQRRLRLFLWVFVLATVAHFLFAPVPMEPKPFKAPPNPGYTGPFARNTRLSEAELVPLPGAAGGPEDGAISPDGQLYVSLRDGTIARMPLPETGHTAPLEAWAQTGGVPLGLDFDANGTLWVADAFLGLLSIDPKGRVRVRCSTVDDTPIDYADDVVVARDGRVYFTDASTKFGAKAHGGTYPASVLDTFEHGNYGRLIRYDPERDEAVILRGGLAFANGVALSHDDSVLYLSETGNQRILTLQRTGDRAGQWGVLIDGLPGFPDNIETGRGGRLWVGLVVPRNAMLDMTADKPFLRKLAFRLPATIRPKAASYGHLIAVDASGQVVQDLQSPAHYTHVTGAVETPTSLFVTSLTEPSLARLPAP